MENHNSNLAKVIQLQKGWSLSISRYVDMAGGYTYFISGDYSPEYQQAHSFHGGRDWSQPNMRRYPIEVEAENAGRLHYEHLKKDPGFPYPDHMAGGQQLL